MVIFGGAAVWMHNMEIQVYNEELSRPFGDEDSAAAAALPYANANAKWGSAGLAGLIFSFQVTKVIKWNKLHKADMAKFVSDWR